MNNVNSKNRKTKFRLEVVFCFFVGKTAVMKCSDPLTCCKPDARAFFYSGTFKNAVFDLQ